MFGNGNYQHHHHHHHNHHPYWTKSVKSDFKSFVPTTPSVWVPNALVTDMGIYVRMGAYYNNYNNYHPSSYYVPSQYGTSSDHQFIDIVKSRENVSPTTSEEGGVCELSRKIRRIKHNQRVKYRISYHQHEDEIEEETEEEEQQQIATRAILVVDDDDEQQRLCENMQMLPPPSQPKKKWLKHYMNGNHLHFTLVLI